MRLNTLIFFALFFSACATKPPVIGSPEPTPAPTVTPDVILSPTFEEFKLVPDSSATLVEAMVIEEAQNQINKIVKSECFKKEFEAPGLKLNETKGMTTAEIAAYIGKGGAALRVGFYKSFWPYTSTVAFYDPEGIHFNRRQTGGWSACDYASTGLHEISHALGFTHPVEETASRPMTVPYFLNRVVDKCCYAGPVNAKK